MVVKTAIEETGNDFDVTLNNVIFQLQTKRDYPYSNEDMILALAGQFKQLSHEPEKFR